VLTAVLVAVAGLTQTPLDYPVICLFWVLLGAGLQSSVVPLASGRALVGSTGLAAADMPPQGLWDKLSSRNP
jgi:hypothetical protein